MTGLSLLATIALVTTPTRAGDLSLDELLNLEVTTASKKAEKLSDAPGVISVVTADEIERYGARNLYDVLDFVTGTTSNHTMTFPSKMQGIRGDDSERSNHQLLLIDGRPARRSVDGGFSYPILMAFPIDTIERVEVIRGPGSVLYGSTAYTGVVNVITKRAEEGEHEGTVFAGAGSFATGEARGSYAHTTKNGVSITGGARYTGTRGYTVDQADSNGNPGSTNMDERAAAATLNVAHGGLTAFGIATYTANPSFGGDFAWGERLDTTAFRFVGDIGYALSVVPGFDLQANVTMNHSEWLSNYFVPTTLFEGLYGEQTDSQMLSNDYIGELTAYISPSDRVNWLVGGSIERQTGRFLIGDEQYLDINLGILEPYAQDWLSAYTQLDYRPVDPIKLVVGAQLNKPDGVAADLVPRIGVITNVTKHFGFKVLSGQAFRSAYGWETSFDVPTLILPNPNLRPEKITTLDAQIFGQAGPVQAALTGFQSEQEGLMAYSAIDDPFYDNTVSNSEETLVIRGLELELKAFPVEELMVLANVAVGESFGVARQRPQITDWMSVGVPVFWAPEERSDEDLQASLVLGKVGASYRHRRGLTASAFAILRGPSGYMTSDQDFSSVTDRPGAAFVDLNLRGQANLSSLLNLDGPELALGITGTNVLNQIRYEGFGDGPYQIHAPAGVWGDLTVQF